MDVIYSGLDYMLLHNLYYIAFRKEDFLIDNRVTHIITPLENCNQTIIGNEILSANNDIIGSIITYQASSRIEFEPGFTVSNSKFKAEIKSKESNYVGSMYKELYTYDCVLNLKSLKVNKSDLELTENFKNQSEISYNNELFEEEPDKSTFSNHQKISIFPNPVNDVLNINLKNIEFPVEITIINNVGSVVKSSSILTNEYQCNISNFPSGIYYIFIKDNINIYKNKIVISN